MGQTLTHGIYLPDEGERNCYNGLAANWQLLDGAVGTVAEHTSQIAGKAPLVHTHTKADITDFPALATVATSGSYNDLSNIPASFTPASHSHGNITNDGKVGTTANVPLITGTGGVVQTGAFGNAANTFCEGNDSRLSDARTPVAHTHGKADVTDLLNSNFIPSANNSYDLGSSSYQWNNLYAQTYYYKGIAWGLDKNNKWLTTNVFYGSIPILLRGSDNDIYNVSPQSLVQSLINFVDKNNTTMSCIAFQHRVDATETHRLCLRQQRITDNNYYGIALNNLGNFYPENNNAINLGTSTNKWKFFNGINPGALSLPVTALNNTYDISGNITDLTGGNNAITAAITGWIFVKSDNATEISIANTTTGMGASDHSASATTLMVSIPVTSGETLNIIANCTSIDKAYLLPCQGNV